MERISFTYDQRDRLSHKQMSLFFIKILFESCISLTTFKTDAVVEWLERLKFVKSVVGQS